ncbi:MAG: FliG C-terminal domain-containing protein [Pirellulales bacterium]
MRASKDTLRKAAVLLVTLDRNTVDALLDQMDPRQAVAVRQAMMSLGEVDDREQDEVIGEFLRLGPLVPNQQPPGIELDGSLARKLSLARQEYPDESAEEAGPCEKQPFRFLHEAESEKLRTFLEGERPQTVAVVVSHLPPQRAAELLAGLPPARQVEVIRRLVDLDETDPEILHEIELGLQSRLSEDMRSQRRRAAGLAAMASILEVADPRLGSQILNNLAIHDRRLAAKLGRREFTFEDMAQLDDATLAAILRAADPDLAILALTGASAELASRILGRLAPHEAGALRHAMENLGPTRLSDVEEAQCEIAQLAVQLECEGRVQLGRAPRWRAEACAVSA